MSKHARRITVVFDAQFGADSADEFDRDDNAYTHSLHRNILGALAAGDIAEGMTAHLELGTGDVVDGTLVAITAADPAEAGGTWRVQFVGRGDIGWHERDEGRHDFPDEQKARNYLNGEVVASTVTAYCRAELRYQPPWQVIEARPFAPAEPGE